MSAAEVVTIGGVVMTLVQIVKMATGDGYSIYIAGAISLLAVGIWVASSATFPPDRTDLWSLFSGFVAVFATAAGLHSISTVPTSKAERRRRARVNADDERAAEQKAEQAAAKAGKG